MPNALAAIERECSSPEVKLMVEFVKQAKRGISAGIGEREGEAGESILPRKKTQTNVS